MELAYILSLDLRFSQFESGARYQVNRTEGIRPDEDTVLKTAGCQSPQGSSPWPSTIFRFSVTVALRDKWQSGSTPQPKLYVAYSLSAKRRLVTA